MKLITRNTLAAEAASKWQSQYGGDRDGKSAAIRLLGDKPDPDAVDAIIGNDSWTRVPCCDECGLSAVSVVEIGEELDYESATAQICANCLRSALALCDEASGDICKRLRNWFKAVNAVPAIDLMEEAAGEIERLRLTDYETEALRKALLRAREDYTSGRFADSANLAASIEGLLERLG